MVDRVSRSWKEMLLTVISQAKKGDTVVVGTEQQKQWAIEGLKQMKIYDHVIICLDEGTALPHLKARGKP